MQLHRTRSLFILLAIAIGSATAARAQEEIHPDLQPFHPFDLGNLKDMQIWKPYIDDGSQDSFWKGNYGPYFRYERFYWSIHQPHQEIIGTPGFGTFGVSEATTGFMKAAFVWGNRFEIGYVNCDNYGWDSTIIKSNDQYNTMVTSGPTSVGFANDFVPVAGGLAPVPLEYLTLTAENVTRFAGVDVLKTFRYEPTHNGGLWGIGLGAKFFQIHDRFTIRGTTVPNTVTTSTLISDTGAVPTLTGTTQTIVIDTTTTSIDAAPNYISTGVDNNMVGPEVKLNWQDKKGRWTFMTEFRFTPTANFQTVKQTGSLGSGVSSTTTETTTTIAATTLAPPAIVTSINTQIVAQTAPVVPPGQPTNSFSHAMNQVSFAPIGELRVDTAYELTKCASIRVGYTGTLVSGLSRASRRVDYTLPDAGIMPGPSHDHTYINGVNVGFDINY